LDDILSGGDTIQEAVKTQMKALLIAGGFELSKWAGSHKVLCPDGNNAQNLLSDSQRVGALGVIWNPGQDTLALRSAPTWTNDKEPTKRLILSHIARIFDPAGWAVPVFVTAKILLQDLWKVALEWDQSLSEPLYSRWQQLAAGMPKLINIQIPRWTGISIKSELHAFADASGKAYTAAVYSRALSFSDEWMSSLPVAKIKVAPLRLISIPRLELCGALPAIRLLRNVADGLCFLENALYAWSDASVGLSWIRTHPSKWESIRCQSSGRNTRLSSSKEMALCDYDR